MATLAPHDLSSLFPYIKRVNEQGTIDQDQPGLNSVRLAGLYGMINSPLDALEYLAAYFSMYFSLACPANAIARSGIAYKRKEISFFDASGDIVLDMAIYRTNPGYSIVFDNKLSQFPQVYSPLILDAIKLLNGSK